MLSRRHFLAAGVFLAGSLRLPAFAAAPVGPAAADDAIEISGKITGLNPRELTLDEIRKLPKAQTTTHTPWHSGAVKFEGAFAQDLMNYIGASGQTLKISALDDYSIKAPIADFAKYGAIVAYRINDRDLTVETKGPLFLIYPFDEKPQIANETFYSRCIWQIGKIDVE